MNGRPSLQLSLLKQLENDKITKNDNILVQTIGNSTRCKVFLLKHNENHMSLYRGPFRYSVSENDCCRLVHCAEKASQLTIDNIRSFILKPQCNVLFEIHEWFSEPLHSCERYDQCFIHFYQILANTIDKSLANFVECNHDDEKCSENINQNGIKLKTKLIDCRNKLYYLNRNIAVPLFSAVDAEYDDDKPRVESICDCICLNAMIDNIVKIYENMIQYHDCKTKNDRNTPFSKRFCQQLYDLFDLLQCLINDAVLAHKESLNEFHSTVTQLCFNVLERCLQMLCDIRDQSQHRWISNCCKLVSLVCDVMPMVIYSYRNTHGSDISIPWTDTKLKHLLNLIIKAVTSRLFSVDARRNLLRLCCHIPVSIECDDDYNTYDDDCLERSALATVLLLYAGDNAYDIETSYEFVGNLFPNWQCCCKYGHIMDEYRVFVSNDMKYVCNLMCLCMMLILNIFCFH